ncbi:Ger(x)C family spore germination protein [Paenibacillus sp. sptzw28]|uniref:Ger(x)C family spore germination protein n=1 Tax=Paenibacillus sp. sptzw28 TaxID=715179 RepID=UPI001C6E69C0|nr:Ger(x)C family spore germination protein [Paenibacillus sp. sptzw28]QYR21817.1 Ger(x)C family spore germination protein [Paenibacillus sp. sptzw28]
MNLHRIVYRCMAFSLSLALLAGCWDRKETDDLALVMAGGLDLTEDGKLESTLQIALPTGIPGAIQSGGKAKRSVIVVSAEGKDSTSNLDRLQQQLSRRIFLGHRGVIVFGENFARHGFDQVLDTLMRGPESRYNSFIVTAYGATAKEILNTPYELEPIPAIGMNKIQSGHFSVGVKIDEFLHALASNGQAPVTAGIRIINKGSGNEIFVMDKAAVYNGIKLAGFLSGMDLKVFRMMIGDLDGMKLTTQLEPPKKEFNGIVSSQLLQVKAKIQTEMKGGAPAVTISVKVRARIISNNTRLDMSKPQSLNLLQKKYADDLKKAFAKTVKLAQTKYKADIFGIGRELHIQHPGAWNKLKNQWKTIYPKVPVQIKTEFEIERIGRTQAPAHLQK